jgi:hypothetical protein
MIILFAHTFHAFQPLDVSYLKPLKTTFRKVMDAIMAKNNYMELDKITLDGWMHGLGFKLTIHKTKHQVWI